MATITGVSTSLPASGGEILAEPLTDTFNAIINFIQGSNIDENNVNLSATNGIVGKSTAQTITGLKTFTATDVAGGGIATAVRIALDPASGTVAAGDGPRVLFLADDSAGNATTIGEIRVPWVTVTDGATEAAKFDLYARAANVSVLGMSLNGGIFSGLVNVGIGGAAVNTGFVTLDPIAFTAIANTNIARLNIENTAAITVPAGTTAVAASVFIGEPNLTATGTITSAVTLYIEAAPTEGGTNNFALWVDSGTTKLDGALTVDGTVTLNGTTVALASGAALSWNSGDVTETHAANTLTWAGATSGYVFNGGNMYIGDTSNVHMTLGLTINQGAATDNILEFKQSGLAHGMTAEIETDSFCRFATYGGTTGGLELDAWSTGAIGIRMIGKSTSDTTTKTSSSAGCIVLMGQKRNGTGGDTVGIDANLVVIQNNGTTAFIFDKEGSAHADVEWIAFADYDDVALVHDIEAELLTKETSNQTGRRHYLEATGIVDKDSWRFENGAPRAMINFTRLSMLHHGTLMQLGERVIELESQLKQLPERN